MKLYRAETGKRVQIPQLRPNDGLDVLRLAIEKATRIPQASQILMTSDGLQLKPDMMFDAITSTGKDEYTIMVYNREVLTTDIRGSILTLTEQAKTEPTIIPLSASQLQPIALPARPNSPTENREWGVQFQRIFEAYVNNVLAYYKAIVSHAAVCERIMEELRVQSLAVQVALTNLDAHSRSVLETFEKFNAIAIKEFTKQARLLQSFPRDIEALRQIKVHPALLPADSPERYISDFIPTDKLVVWAERCREIHEGLLRDGKDLSQSVKEVQDGTVAIRSNSGINLEQLEDAMSDILQTLEQQSQIRERVVRDQSRVKERLAEISKAAGFSGSASTLEALVQLANVYVSDYLDSSRHADEMLRDKLGIFISAKRSQTANLISQLMHISKLQSTIASIPPSLSNLDESLRKRDADFSQLVYVQRIPIAYGALVVEIVRRREYSKLLLQKSQQLAEVMSRFRQLEQRRRDSFRTEVSKFVPVVVPGLEDVPPYCEINALNTRDRLPSFTREHIAEFERLVNQLSIGLGAHDGNESHVLNAEQSTTGTSSITSGQEINQDGLSKLRLTLTKMTAQMDIMGGEFDRILEKSFLTERVLRLEEENARLKADISRADIQQRSGTPQLAQHSYSRHGTPAGGVGGSTGQGSTTTIAAGGLSTNPPSSPKLSRQPSRGSSSTPAAHRAESEEQQLILQQQMQQNQRLTKENAELSTKTKAYEARIRSLEETLYQNFRAGPNTDSSVSSKDSRHQQAPMSPVSDQPWKSPEDIQAARSQSLAKERERKQDEERLLSQDQELQEAYQKLEQAEARLQDQSDVETGLRQELIELRQELMELQLQSAALEDASNDDKSADILAAERMTERLGEELKDMTLKYEQLLQEHDSHRTVHEDILAQLEDQKQRVTDALEEEQKVKEEYEKLRSSHTNLEEDHEILSKAHAEVQQAKDDLAKQAEKVMQEYDIVSETLKALSKDNETLKEAHADIQRARDDLVQQATDLSAKHADTQKTRDELAQQVETLRQQISDLESQREAYKVDVNLRLEEAKTMVRRAEEDWKKKSRLLDQMERATQDLTQPIQDAFGGLGLEEMSSDIADLDQVRERILEIVQGIQALVSKHHTALSELEKAHKNHVTELQKERVTGEDSLKAALAELRKSSQEAETDTAALRKMLASTTTQSKEESDDVLVLLSTLALDLGISLPTLSAMAVSPDFAYPSSSVLLDTSEKQEKQVEGPESRTKSDSNLHSHRSSSVIISSSSGTSRSSSTTTPLSKEILQTFDFKDLNVVETTALIKKKLLDTEHLLRRWQRECKHLKEKYNRASTEAHEKIAFRNFKVDDLTLFLPTRNSISKPWAAFNINFPHYFLQMTPSMANQLKNREWIVARITSITEAIVDKRLEEDEDENESGVTSSSSSVNTVSPHNPFGLADGVKYYLLEATSWNGSHGHGHSKASSSYHSSSSREARSSKIRHHASTSALNDISESSSSSRRDQESVRGSKDEFTSSFTLSTSQLPPTGQSGTSTTVAPSTSATTILASAAAATAPATNTATASTRNSLVGAPGPAPISIPHQPHQSAATNALRAISSSVGSTGSGGSGSISSLLAHHLGSGSVSGSTATLVASSPPRTMILSSSSHITGVSTVSAMGTTVGTVGSGGGGNGPSSPSLGSSAVFGSSSSVSNAPVHPSRLSMSSNRDDMDQLAVFATDEDQEQDRQRQQQQQQRDAIHRTTSSSSTWHQGGM
ncbi:oligomeric, coiled-coil, peripheral membrane protein [Dissophora globulifera]|nr:oligomeric, coiled-coil, peripheral membrane protein [Dissophora globulifera]